MIEGADPIARDHDDAIPAAVVVADLPAVELAEPREVELAEGVR